ncbi:MAG: hypothetical protein EAZ65_02185 [Verrucomicrobia bacterium]|nr:MAG: hypothetical protein EAZ84_04440 [Verrucomicrobiota bacterium]TAE88932.1 MAG: hypothetical protein EAZ82_02545 [Verrucomicrobiota bacterium]TAF27348.1 MAG: hypothetical protein EAZ71_02505 [Verrucomicrobiota bacterium]TAF42361.1 MAG: hypothetical protein EAZ65_02185 [Verrucomicrobiota bacterium]
MAQKDSDPQNYSIDDMMERLRSHGEGPRDGEPRLVTREDGSQMYRMRKRKRRTEQPKKEKEKRQQRFRVAQVVFVVAIILLAGLGVLGGVIYLNSSAYRAVVLGRIRTWTGAEPQLTQFRVSPVGAAARAIELTWPKNSILANLKVDAVAADLQFSSIFGGAWKGSEMTGASGKLLLRRPVAGAVPADRGQRGECPFQFRYRIPKFSVMMGEVDRPALRVQDSEASLIVLDPAAGTSNLQLEGGTLNLVGLGDFPLEFASLQFENGGVRVGTARLLVAKEGRGEIEILNRDQGTLDLAGGHSELGLRVQQLPLTRLLGASFGEWLTAEIESPEVEGDGSLRFRTDEASAFSFRIPFRATASSNSVTQSLPFLTILADAMEEPWYQAPRFDAEAQGVLVREAGIVPGNVGVDELRLESRGRLFLAGRVMADANGNLTGKLEVGLPVAAISDLSPSFRSVFQRREGGYAWATVNISGTGRQPMDDLKQQLADADTTVAPMSGGEESVEDAFRDLTTPESR